MAANHLARELRWDGSEEGRELDIAEVRPGFDVLANPELRRRLAAHSNVVIKSPDIDFERSVFVLSQEAAFPDGFVKIVEGTPIYSNGDAGRYFGYKPDEYDTLLIPDGTILVHQVDGADVTVTDAAGNTPLHSCESVEVAAALLKAGGNVNAANQVRRG